MKRYFSRCSMLVAVTFCIGHPVNAQNGGPQTALSFTAANGQFVQVPASTSLTPNQVTFEAWVNPHTAKCNTILSRGNGNTANTDYIFQVGYDGTTCGVMRLALFGVGAWDTSTSLVPLNVWTHVAISFDGTNKIFYINGVPDGTNSRPGSFFLSGSAMYIGRQGVACDCNFFDGAFDEVRIWNVVRTQSQIATNMNRSLTGTESGLVSYYRFDEGSGTNVADATPNGHNGTFGGGVNNPAWVQAGEALGAPFVTTLAASAITSNSVTLEGSVNPESQATGAWFQWGITTNYSAATTITNISAGTNSVAVSAALIGLNPGATYYYRITATNSSGTSFGSNLTFTTPVPPPTIVSTQPASNITASAATFQVSVNPNGADTTVFFQLGTTTNYGSNTASVFVSGTNTSPVTVTILASNLSQALTYHFQAVATNGGGGVAFGADQIFTTTIFTELGQFSIGPAAYSYNSICWGDYDNDGRLDVLVAGFGPGIGDFIQIWRNTGNGFSNINAGLPSLSGGYALWGDYDNDGKLDVLVSGYAGGSDPTTQVWRNTGNGFTNINAGLPAIATTSMAWGDYDNDGRLDILLSGQDGNGNELAQVWRNTGNGFVNINAGLPDGYWSSATWVDYDNDGRLDILLTGKDKNVTPASHLFRNTGNGFSEVNVGLPAGNWTSVAWGDYDNDGRLDALLSGFDANGNSKVQLWRNTPTGFTNVIPDLAGVVFGSVIWGDYDNDGRLDILFSGSDTNGTSMTQLWRNTGNGFININANLPASYGPAAWGDYDNDGRLDVLAPQETVDGFFLQVQQNGFPTPNSPPTAPSGLSVRGSPSAVTLNWNAASDAQTPTTGLKYNVRVGTSPGGSDVVGPEADTGNGFRRVPSLGNAQANRFLTLSALPTGVYYWSVQAIDTAFAGSPFATEGQFAVGPLVITGAASQIKSNSAVLNGTVDPNGFDTIAQFQWGTTTAYGNVASVAPVPGTNVGAVAVTNQINGLIPGTTYHYQLMAMNGQGTTYGLDSSFTAASSPPNIISELAASFSATNATLEAMVNPNGAATTVFLSYGTNLPYAFTNALGNIGSQPGFVPMTNNILNLSPGALYHFQFSASNSVGSTPGGDQTFVAANSPTATTQPATGITSAGAVTLRGTGFPNGADATVWFLWGTTTSYSNSTPSCLLSKTNRAAVPFAYALSGLTPGTVYHFQAVVSNSLGVSFGADLLFGIPAPAKISALMADTSGFPNVTLNGLLNPNGSDATASFQWGTTSNYSNATPLLTVSGTNTSDVPVSALLTNLLGATAYHFRLTATNAIGTTNAPDQSFMTPYFTPVGFDLPPIKGRIAWGDFDNDGLLDFVVVGVGAGASGYDTEIWRNTGNGFSNINAGIPGFNQPAVAWGDYDNDGRLDLLISGQLADHSLTTQIWRNTGNGFSNINAGITGIVFGSVAWGDYDNDGRLDVLISGNDIGGNPITQVWRNTGNGFSNINAALPQVGNSSAAWGDYDNDGRLDILLSGNGVGPFFEYIARTEIWRNTGSGFSNINAGLTGTGNYSSVAWGDFDNDGRLDVLYSGETINGGNTGFVSEVWRNTTNGFTNMNVGLPGTYFSSVAWGDFDNDGRLDILLSGEDSGINPVFQLWRNTGNGFSYVDAGLTPYDFPSAAWGDYDNDGRLDILLSAHRPDGYAVQILHNWLQPTNSAPSAPTGLSSIVSGSTVTLKWNAASDAQTASPGLSYNVRVGRASGGLDVLAPQANSVTGYVRVPQLGNAQLNQFAFLTNLSNGTYYWSVQAVDTSFAGSHFASEAQFTITNGVLPLVPPQLFVLPAANNGAFQISFTAAAGQSSFTVLTSTNLALPLASWSVLGTASNVGANQFQFSIQPAANSFHFYAVRSP